MSDALKGYPVEIAGQKFTLIFNNKALRVAQRKLARPVADVIPPGRIDLGMDVLCELAAAGIMHERLNASDELIEELLDQDPGAYFPLNTAVRLAFYEAQTRLLTPEMQEAMRRSLGEAKAPLTGGADVSSAVGPTTPSTSGSAAGTGSIPT